ncbi:MAG: Uma2 family endonuclease [Planctomycetota bacterium]
MSIAPPSARPTAQSSALPIRPGVGEQRRLYLTEADYWKLQATAERLYEWKSGLGLFDDAGEELGEALPKDGYDEDGTPAMPTFRHVKLVREWLVRLDRLLEESGFEAVSEGLAVRIPRTGRCRYPDVVVLPSPPHFEADTREEQRVATDPIILIEVLSDSTESEDLNAKLGDYASIPSVTDYLIVAQDEPLVLHYRRPAGAAEEDEWRFSRHSGREAVVTLAEPTATLTLAEIYARALS